jgi:hypothetical protein
MSILKAIISFWSIGLNTNFFTDDIFTCTLILMKITIQNFLNAIAPLSSKKKDLGEILVISFLESQWKNGQTTQVNDVLNNIKSISSASINRKLKNLKKNHVLSFNTDIDDERIKIISKGKNFNTYIKDLEKCITDNESIFFKKP